MNEHNIGRFFMMVLIIVSLGLLLGLSRQILAGIQAILEVLP